MSSVPTIWHHASSTYFNTLGCCLVSALERQSQDSPTTARAMGGDFHFSLPRAPSAWLGPQSYRLRDARYSLPNLSDAGYPTGLGKLTQRAQAV